MKYLESDKKLGTIIPNIAQMLQKNAKAFKDKAVYQEKRAGKYQGISWKELYEDIQNIASNLRNYGFVEGDKMVLFSKNQEEMLKMELAVMASGGIAVPIFSNFMKETAELLINHSDARFLSVSGELQLSRISPKLPLQQIFTFDDTLDPTFSNITPFSELLRKNKNTSNKLFFDAAPNDICLNMYTSGTMGIPKCVQLTHENILSQQAALNILWKLDDNDRFLSYLPWHHSFGGIFELFTALYNGATLSLESGYGKEPKKIMENWKEIKPTVFFSVPKVFQSLIELTKENKEAEKIFFNSGLKFVFTAAAPLPQNISDEFEKRGIPVVEGWGLTETSPCCALTDPKLKREPGVVGMPLPGIKIGLGEDKEILIKGPNVMKGYYKNDEANKDIFTDDGWFKTGDIGAFANGGLKLVTRKDRIFKLLNGEKVIPTDLEKVIEKKCFYISHAVVTGGGKEYPVALLFPNKKLFENPDYDATSPSACFNPRDINELSRCLRGCLHDANCDIKQKFSKVKAALLIDDELGIEKGTLTPSLKVAPNNVIKAYKIHLENLYGADISVDEDYCIIELDNKK